MGRLATISVWQLVLAGLATLMLGCGDEGTAELDLSKAGSCWSRDEQVVIALDPRKDPIEQCGRFWQRGVVDGQKSSPALTVCVGNNGTAWVFPTEGDDTCEKHDRPSPK